MAAKVITLSIQKGGTGKSTTTCILAHLLAKDGYKVLVVDMDSQGNSTELLTDMPCNEFINKSVMEAIINRDPQPFIFQVNEQIDILPSNNLLATFARWLYTGVTWSGEKTKIPKEPIKVLAETLEKVQNDYDYILIDTPPSLSEHTTNAFLASTHVVVMYECSRWCYSAIPNLFETLEGVVSVGNHQIDVAGILRTLSDGRRTDMKYFSEIIHEDYPELVFEQVITRSAAIGRISINGFEDNPELKAALGPHLEFYKEFMARVDKKQVSEV